MWANAQPPSLTFSAAESGKGLDGEGPITLHHVENVDGVEQSHLLPMMAMES